MGLSALLYTNILRLGNVAETGFLLLFETLRSSGDISPIVGKSMHFVYLYRYNWSFIQIFCLK